MSYLLLVLRFGVIMCLGGADELWVMNCWHVFLSPGSAVSLAKNLIIYNP